MTTKNGSNDNQAQPISFEITNDDVASYRAAIREPQVRNADNEWLGSFGGPAFRVGYLDNVNGPGASEVIGFVPTRHELLELARYWANVAVDIEYLWFLYQQVGSSDMRRQPFAWRRVGRIHELLGADADKVVNEVYEEYGKKEDQRSWEVFRHGTAEQREAFQEELQRALEECDGNHSDRQ